MNIAYIGNENECSIKVCNHLSQTHNVTLITNRQPTYEVDCAVIVEKTLWIDNYFEDKDIDIVIYAGIDENYTLLNNWLAAAKDYTRNFLIIKEDHFFSQPLNTYSIEKLLQKEYSHDAKSNITVVNTSVLYGSITVPPSIENIVKKIRKKNIIEVPKDFKSVCDALHIEDFCRFLEKYIEGISERVEQEVYVQSGYMFSANDLFQKLSKRYPQAINLYDNDALLYSQKYSAIHLDEWTPTHSFMEDLFAVIDATEKKLDQGQKEKKLNALKTGGKIALFLLLFLLVELYTNFMAVASDLQFVDMRLILISVSAIILGKKYAVSAALLCSVTSILQSISNGFRWDVLFFHVNNWIPIATYIVFAIIVGSYADRLRKKAKIEKQ